MLDSLSIKLIRKPLALSATYLDKCGITANQTTVFGFVLGCFALPALIAEQYLLALLFILLNRICDGLDGALARIQGITDAGGFLDISLDFLFYSLIPFGFVLAIQNKMPLQGHFDFFFVGTGSSFYLLPSWQGNKASIIRCINTNLYYMSGLTEGTETIGCFVLFCLMPQHFSVIAYIFGAACWFTTFTRIYSGFHTLKGR